MASNADFVQYIADQCGGAGEIVVKKMFGDYGIYCNGKIFGLICDDRFYLKPTGAARPMREQRTISTSPMWTTATICLLSSVRLVRHCLNQRGVRNRAPICTSCKM